MLRRVQPRFHIAAVAGLVVALALLACRDPDPRCGSVSGQVPGTLTLSDCSDRRAREVTCTRDDPHAEWTCACTSNRSLGRTFNWPASASGVDDKQRRELESLLLRQCHWSLRLH